MASCHHLLKLLNNNSCCTNTGNGQTTDIIILLTKITYHKARNKINPYSSISALNFEWSVDRTYVKSVVLNIKLCFIFLHT